MKIEQYICDAIEQALLKLNYRKSSAVEIRLERPKQEEHGDFSSNVAMLLSASAKKSPRIIASEIVAQLQFDNAIIEKVTLAGPGFINFYFGWDYYRQSVRDILSAGEQFGKSDWGQGKKVQVEFVSANPTGPLNVVSARAASVGDVLTNLLNAVGFKAYKEYYVNDAGRQIQLLGESISSHYMNIWGIEEKFPEEGYHGEYLREMAQEIADEHGDRFTKLAKNTRFDQLTDIAVKKILHETQDLMKTFGVNYDYWFRESQLRAMEAHLKILEIFQEKKMTYEQDGAVWFKSTEFGDEKDRVLVTQEGNPTYFLIDIAYHKNKYERGFETIYDLLGPDHHGYVPRMSAAIQALGHPRDSYRVEIIQQVNLLRDGEVMKMSKRAGRIIEMKEVVDEVGVDAARFFFINRRMSSHLDFDIDLAKKQSDENPVYYLQYAHARICSILRVAEEEKGIDISQGGDLHYLANDEEKALIKGLLQYPEFISWAAASLEPHLLPNYLQDVAALFHRFYHYHRVITDDVNLTLARLSLVKATKIVLANGFKILGISAPERM